MRRSAPTIARLGLLAALAAGSVACDDGAAAPPAGAAAGCAKKVLILVDEVPGGAAPLAVALSAAGLQVTTSDVASSAYAGTPPLAGNAAPDAVVVLSGGQPRTPHPDMPAEGQQAIVDFVAAGHGLVLTEWAAFHVAAEGTPRWQTLAPLVLLGRTGGHSGQVTYEVEPSYASHPIWAGLPAAFSFTSSSNVGRIHPAPGVARLARSPQVLDAVAIRDLPPAGRVVHLAHAGNHVVHGWTNVNLLRLVANAVGWAARCD
ncbi:MAG: hypothetical protein IT373_36725 [Polyangiaceae bacterium]|nr:hypothetical protein [Polyangiaceae bacterium]